MIVVDDKPTKAKAEDEEDEEEDDDGDEEDDGDGDYVAAAKPDTAAPAADRNGESEAADKSHDSDVELVPLSGIPARPEVMSPERKRKAEEPTTPTSVLPPPLFAWRHHAAVAARAVHRKGWTDICCRFGKEPAARTEIDSEFYYVCEAIACAEVTMEEIAEHFPAVFAKYAMRLSNLFKYVPKAPSAKPGFSQPPPAKRRKGR